MSNTRDIETLIGRAQTATNAARAQVESRGMVDLGALMDFVQRINTAIAAVPRSEALTIRGRLLALYDDLDRLGDDMRRVQADTTQKLKDLSAGARAAAAYGGSGGKR
jgi:hypothetical protein